MKARNFINLASASLLTLGAASACDANNQPTKQPESLDTSDDVNRFRSLQAQYSKACFASLHPQVRRRIRDKIHPHTTQAELEKLVSEQEGGVGIACGINKQVRQTAETCVRSISTDMPELHAMLDRVNEVLGGRGTVYCRDGEPALAPRSATVSGGNGRPGILLAPLVLHGALHY